MKLLSALTTAGIGAALVYLFDPDSGNRRRALMREKAGRTVHEAQKFFDSACHDLQNRSRGMMEEMRARYAGQEVDDDRLVRRVAAKLGHHMSKAKAVGVIAENGVVTLQGPIMSSEVDAVVRAINRIPGVRELRNELQVQESPNNPELLAVRKRWTPARRLAVGSAGLLLAASTRSLMRGRRRA